jgi:hypothetical protein
MRSQLRFAMHPDDELDFAVQVLSDPSVCLIDGPRWKTSTPETFRSIKDISGSYCIIWSEQDRSTMSARYIPSCDDWYCESEEVTIQFLRSEVFGSVITEGRIAASTQSLGESEAAGVERRFKALSRFIKKNYFNSIVCWRTTSLPFAQARPGQSANPGVPDAKVWVGPHALRWLQQNKNHHIKQDKNSFSEARLVDAA